MKSFLKAVKQDNGQQTSTSSGANPAIPPYPAQVNPASSHRIYVLPYPPPPPPPSAYRMHVSQQQGTASITGQQENTPQTDLPSQENAVQSDQPIQQNFPHSSQVDQKQQPHQSTSLPTVVPQQSQPPAQPPKISPQPSQSAHPHYYYSGQPGVHQSYYGPWQPPPYPPPPYQYGGVYPGPPPKATDAPMIREGPFRRQQEDSDPEGWTGFIDKKIRAAFIRKVYIILTMQLLFTVGIIALFIYEPNVKRFVQKHAYLLWLALAVFFSVYIGLVCFQSVRRRFPLNIIALIVFTMAMSYMAATISTVYDTDIVLLAMGICAAVSLTVTIFSFYTKFDFTSCGGILCILLLVLIFVGIITIFFPTMVMRMIYAALGAIVFTLFLAYDTQMMMGGKNYELSPEDYVFAAVQIYIDIVYIFLYLLSLLGAIDEL